MIDSASEYFKSYVPSRTNPPVVVIKINGSSLAEIPSAIILYNATPCHACISSHSAKYMFKHLIMV